MEELTQVSGAARMDEVEEVLQTVRPKLPLRLIRQVITCIQVGEPRRKDPPGVSISQRSLTGAGDRDPPVQICFSFDTTGSMAAWIEAVRREVSSLTQYLLANIPGIQVSIAAHGDYGDESNYVVKAKDFSNDTGALARFIGSCTNTGGGDAPECYELVMHKMQELSWAATSAKALVMIGDAPPHDEKKYAGLGRPFIDWRREAQWYAKRGIHVYGVKCGSHCKQPFYDKIAEITNALAISLQDVGLMPELFTELCFREQQRWALAMHPPPRWDVRAIADPKAALLSVCGSCLLAEPCFHARVDDAKDRIRLLCRRLAREGHGEFVLKMALYCRTRLYLRSVPSYILALAAQLPGCREHLNEYLRHNVRLPSDMHEVAKMSISINAAAMAGGQRVWLPKALRKAFAKKFPDFSEYQLAKHNKVERLGPDGRWTSSATSGCGGKKQPAHAEEEEAAAEERGCGPVLTMKGLVRTCHISEPHDLVAKLLGKRYPADLEGFADSGLPGEFDEALVGSRLRLAAPLTFQTQLSAKGNTKEAWEELIDKKGLPFMAMLRNLRNILAAGVSDRHHQALLGRLRDPRQVEQSMQMPHRFLTAYLAVDAAQKGEAFGQGGGGARGKGRRGRPAPAAPAAPVHLLPADMAGRYKAALDEAVQLAVRARLPPLSGRTLVLCDVSGSMRYNEFAKSARGIGGVASAADLAILLGLLLFKMSERPGDCTVALFAERHHVLDLRREGGVLDQFQGAKREVDALGLRTLLPVEWFGQRLRALQADRVVLLSDMMLGGCRSHPGGAGPFRAALEGHREASGRECPLVCVDLFGAGATSGVDLRGDQRGGDVLLSGFSDHTLSYIAKPDVSGQLADVEAILDAVRAQGPGAAAGAAVAAEEEGGVEAGAAEAPQHA